MKDRRGVFYPSDYRTSAHLDYIIAPPRNGDIVVVVLEEREVPGTPAPPLTTVTETLTRASLRSDQRGFLRTAARDPALVKPLMWDGALLRKNDLPPGWTVTIVYPKGVQLAGGTFVVDHLNDAQGGSYWQRPPRTNGRRRRRERRRRR